MTDDAPEGACVECWADFAEHVNAEWEDPREPPIRNHLCLCHRCFVSAAEERMEELQDWIDDIDTDRQLAFHAMPARPKRKKK